MPTGDARPLDIGCVRLRRIGHRLPAEGESTVVAHAIAVDAEHRLSHAVPRPTSALIHPDPEHAHDGGPAPAVAPGH